MRFYGLTDVGVKRENNEDSISLPSENDGIKLFILADGMGGAKAGEKASQLAIKTIRDYVRLNFIKIERTKEEIEEVIRKAMVEANKQIFELSMEYKEFNGMGTTVVVVLIYRGRIYIGHIGDSRVYRLRQSVLRQLTKDHSYVQELVRQGTITIEEAKDHPQKNVLLKALGCDRDIEVKQIRVQELKLADKNTDGALVMMNPPYGERLSQDKDVLRLYQDMGTALKHQFNGATAWIISSNEEALKCVGLRPAKRVRLVNGDLDCLFNQYVLFKGDRKTWKKSL